MKKIMTDETIKNAYMKALDIIETVGVKFDNEEIRNFLKEKGAKVEGNRVFIPSKIVEEAIETTPKQDYTSGGEKKVLAATPFSGAPFILDDDTSEIRRCTISDVIKMYQITETSDLYQCANPGFVDPVDNDHEDPFVAQMAMMLKYSGKYPSVGLRATSSTSLNENVYESARKGFRLVREFYDTWDEPAMTQGICPNSPLHYDKECLDNLCAAIDEKQEISLFPCSLTFLSGPETILGMVIHDFAMALAGLTLIQLKSPGHPTAFSEFSTGADIQTLQPAYGSPEAVYTQVAFYEISKYLKLPCSICGSYGDGTAVDYQAGMEALLTVMLPFNLTEVDEVWCYPGHLSGFSCGSFEKAILDEEMIRYANRSLTGINMNIDPNFSEMMAKGMAEGNFLCVGTMENYNKDHYLTKVFSKTGLSQTNSEGSNRLKAKSKEIFKSRIESYVLPEKTKAQEKIIEKYLPKQCSL